MRLLLDTHVLLWAVAAPGRLTPAVRNMPEDAGTSCCSAPRASPAALARRGSYLTEIEPGRKPVSTAACRRFPPTT